MEQIVKITTIDKITHDVLQIKTEKPENITYTAGQAADIAINKSGWEKQQRAFTFTSLQEDDHLEFTVKIYPDHKGVTNQLNTLKVGDELIIGEVFGGISYRGQGLFIAGGAGITPFLAIFTRLQKEHKLGNNILFFANKTKADIILEKQLSDWLGDNVLHILSDEQISGYEHGYISREMIAQALDDERQHIYLCGPPPMMDAIESHCSQLNITSDRIVKESF